MQGKRHKPSDEDRRLVKTLSAVGVRYTDIADKLEIDHDTLTKHYKKELTEGRMAWQFTGPARLTETIHRHKYRDITIYPSHYFLPDHFAGSSYQGKGPVFAKQGWQSTRGTK